MESIRDSSLPYLSPRDFEGSRLVRKSEEEVLSPAGEEKNSEVVEIGNSPILPSEEERLEKDCRRTEEKLERDY